MRPFNRLECCCHSTITTPATEQRQGVDHKTDNDPIKCNMTAMLVDHLQSSFDITFKVPEQTACCPAQSTTLANVRTARHGRRVARIKARQRASSYHDLRQSRCGDAKSLISRGDIAISDATGRYGAA